MISLNPEKASAILLAGAGWQPIVPGSLTIDELQVNPSTPEAEDYGFTCVTTQTEQITGRLSSLLATKQSSR